MLLLIYTTYISVDLMHHEIFCAKVGKSDIKHAMGTLTYQLQHMFLMCSYSFFYPFDGLVGGMRDRILRTG